MIGLVTINLLRPGAGMNVDVATLNTTEAASVITSAREFVSTSEFLLNLLPRTIVSGFADGDILQILVVSVLIGFGLAAAGERAQPMLKVIDSFASGLFWIIGLAMKIAPIAAFGAICVHREPVRRRIAGLARQADWRSSISRVRCFFCWSSGPSHGIAASASSS